MRKLTTEELNRISAQDYAQRTADNLVIVLDNIRSMHNVGSAFRTADGFGIHKLYLCGITATPPHREIEKTALGATLSVPWVYCSTTTEALKTLQSDGYTIILIEQTNESINLDQFTFEANKKYALVFGNEVFGVSDEAIPLGDMAIEIPQIGSKHSLNISVCVGIVIWQYQVTVKATFPINT